MNNCFDIKFTMADNKSYIGGAPSFLAVSLHVGSYQYSSNVFPTPRQKLETFRTPFPLGNGESVPSTLGPFALIKITTITGAKDSAFIETANLCAFSFCAREYKITVQNGLLNSEVLSTSYSKMTWQGDPNLPS